MADLKIPDFCLYDQQKQELCENGWPEYPENFHLIKFWCAELEYLLEKL